MLRAPMIIVALLACSSARAEDRWEWTNWDTGMELAYATLHAVDWSQTLYVARHPPGTGTPPPLWDGEVNPILGRRPSVIGVHAYMAGTLAAHFAVALLLPRPYRSAWQCIGLGVEASAIGWNWTAGVRMSF